MDNTISTAPTHNRPRTLSLLRLLVVISALSLAAAYGTPLIVYRYVIVFAIYTIPLPLFRRDVISLAMKMCSCPARRAASRLGLSTYRSLANKTKPTMIKLPNTIPTMEPTLLLLVAECTMAETEKPLMGNSQCDPSNPAGQMQPTCLWSSVSFSLHCRWNEKGTSHEKY